MPEPATARSPHAEPLFSPANLLSLVRVPLAAVPWLAPGSLVLLLGCMAAAAVSDWLDGWVARRAHAGARPGGRGAWLDPLCDKIFVASVAALVFGPLGQPLLLLPLVMLRELLQLPLLLGWWMAGRGRPRMDFRAGVLGKATTVAQFGALLALVLGHDLATPAAALAGACGLAAVAAYTARGLRGRRREP